MKNAPNANALKNKGKNKMPSKDEPELQSLSKYASHNVKRSFGSVAEFEMVQYMAIIEDNMYENSLILQRQMSSTRSRFPAFPVVILLSRSQYLGRMTLRYLQSPLNLVSMRLS